MFGLYLTSVATPLVQPAEIIASFAAVVDIALTDALPACDVIPPLTVTVVPLS